MKRFRIQQWAVSALVALHVLSAGSTAFSQITLRGRVVDPEGGLITGAHIGLRGSLQATFSNVHGRFLLRGVPAGLCTVEVRLVGFRRLRKEVTVSRADSTERVFVLTPMVYSLQGIDITAGIRSGTDPSSAFTLTSMPPRDVQRRAGAGEDVLRTLQSSPGITSANDFSSQLIIRGSGPDQNLIVMDGIEIYNPYRLYGAMSMFNPQTVRSISVFTGGFPVRYADRLSAVVDVTNRDGSLTRGPFSARANLSLTNLNMVAEGAFLLETREEEDSARADLYYTENAPPWNGSWLLSTRRTYYDLIAGPIVRSSGIAKGEVILPTFQDFQFRLSLQPDYRHKIVFTGITNRDRATLNEAPAAGSIKEITLDDLTFNDVAGLQWTWTHSPDLIGQYSVSFYQNGGSNTFKGQQNAAISFGFNMSSEEYERLKDSLVRAGIDAPRLLRSAGAYNFLFRKFALDATLTWQASSDHTIEGGIAYKRLLNDIDLGVRFDPRIFAIRRSNFRFSMLPDAYASSVNSDQIGAYVQDTYRVGEHFTIEPGLRADYLGILRRAYISPRVSVVYEWNPSTRLRAAWGIYYQSPGYEKSFLPGYDIYLSNTTYDLSSGHARALRAERAVHTALSWETMVTPEWQLRLEGYTKSFRDLVFPKIVTGTVYRTERIEGKDITSPDGWTLPSAVPGDSLTTLPDNSGSGSSFGGEIVLQKVFAGGESGIHGWISYAYGKATRERHGWTYPFDFDRRHTLSVVLGWRMASWLDINVTFTYGSGFPNTPPVAFTPRMYDVRDSVTGQVTPAIDTDWRGVVFVTDRGGLRNLNSGRLPDYHRLDLRATTYTDWWGWEWSLYLDIMNVYNRRNVAIQEYYLERSTLQNQTIQTTMIPFLPSVGFTIAF